MMGFRIQMSNRRRTRTKKTFHRRVEWRRGGGQANGFHRVSPFERRGKMAIRPFTPFPPPSLKFRTAGFPHTGFKRAVSSDLHGSRHLYAATVEISPVSVCSVVGLSPKRHSPSLTRRTRPVALGSASGCSVRQPHRLLRPHPSLWPSASAYGLYPTRSRTPEVPQFTPRAYLVRVVSRTPAVSTAALDCYFTVDAAFAVFASARQPHRQTVRSGLNSVTRLQIRFMLRPDPIACPAPARAFTTELSPRMSPPDSVGYD